jgi:hypothetical protein
MPIVFNVAALLDAYRFEFDAIENHIFEKLKVYREKGIESKREVKRRRAHEGDRCTFDRTLILDAGCWTIPHGPCEASVLRRDPSGSVICTPVISFPARECFDDILKEAERELIRELLAQKPRRIGSLRVICTVNPSRLRYELVLAVPFSKEK